MADSVEEAIARAGKNAHELERAIKTSPPEHKPGILFLIKNMPEHDLRSLSADYLLSNTDYAYRAWHESSWSESVGEDQFFNYILPYAVVTEPRDSWRRGFYDRFRGLVTEAASPGEAAAILNNRIFTELGVEYNIRRRATDQGPLETIDSGMATCTGLSILLIDVCRAVGVPARFVGTAMWSDRSGNHSWVEVWDRGQWRFTGAAEPNGMNLDTGWFTDRASMAKRDSRLHAIFAASFAKTSIGFPCSWAPDRAYEVPAINVTDRYTTKPIIAKQGMSRARFKLTDGKKRVSCHIRVVSDDGKVWLEDRSRDEKADMNDHAWGLIPTGGSYSVLIDTPNGEISTMVGLNSREQLFTIDISKLTKSLNIASPVDKR